MNPGTPGLRVRAMEAGDLDCVLEIAGRLPGAPRWSRQAYLDALNPQAPRRRIALAAEAGEGVIGFAVAGLLESEAELETIAVVPGVQRRGVGRRLLGEIIAILRGLGVTEVTLEVRVSNRQALAFYAAAGFAECGRRKLYYIDPEEDAVMMRLSVAAAYPARRSENSGPEITP